MQADTLWEEDQRRYYLLAARYLEESQHLGFPPDRDGQGLFLLGKSLCLSRQYDASREVLEQALTDDPDEAREIHWLAAAAYQNRNAARFEEGDGAHRSVSGRQGIVAPPNGIEGLLVKGQILFKGGRKEECLALLAKIPPEAPSFADAIVLRGQLLMQAAEKAKADLPAERHAPTHAMRSRNNSATRSRRSARRRIAAVRPNASCRSRCISSANAFCR